VRRDWGLVLWLEREIWRLELTRNISEFDQERLPGMRRMLALQMELPA